MLASAQSATLLGVEGRPVRVEVHASQGLPGFTVVGLPDTTCREARDRVRAALLSSGLTWPMCRVTVNLAPPGLRKVGAGLDLAIAAALLAASEQVPAGALAGRAFVGELGLDGSVRPGAGGAAHSSTRWASARSWCPTAARSRRSSSAATSSGRSTLLSTMVGALRGQHAWPEPPEPVPPPPPPPGPDLADVRGQPVARYALEVAAAGGHHLLLAGPPGAGKTMLARRLAGLLPELAPADALEVTCIHSAAGLPLPPGGLVSPAAVPGAAPRRLVRLAGRRRLAHAAAGRDQPGPPRRPVPRRARRVRGDGARQPAPAPRGGGRSGWPGPRPRSRSRRGSCSWRR